MDSGCLVFGPRRSGSRGGGQLLLFGGSEKTILRGEKRPFISLCADDLFDDEYYDEMQPEKKKRLTPDQVLMLENSFLEDSKLEPERKNEIARQLGLQPRQVAVWFQNRRVRHKTKNLEQEFDRLKANYDALLADHHSLIKDNDSLRLQVVSLTEQLQSKDSSSREGTSVGLGLDHEMEAGNAAAAAVATSPATNGSAIVDTEAAHGHIADSCGESFPVEHDYPLGTLPVCSSSSKDYWILADDSRLCMDGNDQGTWYWDC